MKRQVASEKVPDNAKAAVMRLAEIYEFLGEAEERGIFQDVAEKLLRKGLLNDAIKGYVAMALDGSDLPQLKKMRSNVIFNTILILKHLMKQKNIIINIERRYFLCLIQN